MGVIKAAERREEQGPECPLIFAGTFAKYRELKFIQRETDDSITVYPRDMLTWQDLAAYRDVTRQQFTMLETELIMGLDAIFEGRHDG